MPGIEWHSQTLKKVHKDSDSTSAIFNFDLATTEVESAVNDFAHVRSVFKLTLIVLLCQPLMSLAAFKLNSG